MRQTESSPLQHPRASILAWRQCRQPSDTTHRDLNQSGAVVIKFCQLPGFNQKEKLFKTSPVEISQLSLFSFLPHNNPP